MLRLRSVSPAATFNYQIVEHGGGKATVLPVEVADRGGVCFRPHHVTKGERVIFEVRNGTSAGPLVIHAFDLGTRGIHVVGLTRPRT